jgi:GTPase SAR1 family protein
MPKAIKQIKVFISCPSDVEKEKNIVSSVCETLSRNIFAQKNIHIKTIHWAKDVPRIITGEGPQKIINRYLDEVDYDIYVGILWGSFGEPESNGLTPTEGEFEDALKRCEETGRPFIKFFFKKEKLYPKNEYEANQLLCIQKFKKRIKALGLYDSFITDLQLQEKAFISIQQLIEHLTITKDSQIRFQRIKYNEVTGYIHRKIYPAEKYKTDEFWFLGDKFKEDLPNIVKVKNRIALMGDAGSGKTIELERVANHFSEENAVFYPFLIRLNTYIDQSITSLLTEDWNKIPENQLLIILDGLDEIKSENKKDAIRQIEFFSERYPSSTIIVSCRTNFYQAESEQASGTLSGFESYRLLDLEFEQINSYVNTKLLAKASRFFKEIDKNQLSPLLNIPFYLVNLVEIFEDENSLPERRAMIFQRLVLARVKLDKVHFRTTIDLEEHTTAIFKNLERMALAMECLGRNYLLDDEYRELIPDESSRDLIKHCTAWKKENGGGIRWQFENNSIQEYLAASSLSRQPLSVIKDFVSFRPEYKKIIPSWVNTVSFLFSLSDDSNLINWILEIEPEICLKFEADRIQKETRIKIFKDIFNRYKEKKIWIDRDRFRNDELARFGQSDEILNFLLNEAEKAHHHTTLGNAIEIITAMNIPPDFKDRTRDLLEMVAINNFNIPVNDSIQCTGLIALSRLGFDSKNVVERIVSKLRGSKSDWVRYGLYYFLHESDFLDDFIDVFLEGIPYVSMDFSSGGLTRLGNEIWELKQGLKKTKSPHAVKQIMIYFIGKERDIHDMFAGDHDISFIAEAATKAHHEDPSLLNIAVDFSFSMLDHYHKEEAAQFLKFYEKTGTKFDAFKIGMGKESLYREDFLADLADEKCIEFFIKQYEQEIVSDDLVWKFLYALRWKNNAIFESFYSAINQKSNDRFILKPVPDWDKISKKRRERDIQLIFDKESLLNEIKLIFDTEKKEKLWTDPHEMHRSE